MLSTLRGVGSRSAVIALAAVLFAPAAASAATDLSARMSSDRTSGIVVGEQVVFSIDVRNEGTEPAEGVVITDYLPNELEPVAVQTSQGSCEFGDPVRCALGGLASGGAATVRITTRTKTADRVRNSVLVESQTEDLNRDNNSADVTIQVVGPVGSGPRMHRFRILSSRHAGGRTKRARVLHVGPRGRDVPGPAASPRPRWRNVGAPLKRGAPQGGNALAFRGRVRRKGRTRPLRPGRYRVRAIAVDHTGTRSVPRYVYFRVVR